jgi:zinc protease
MQIFEQLESVGASLGFDSAIHVLGFSGRALTEDLDLLLDLTAEVLMEPTFPSQEIERLRAQILTGLALRAESTESMASLSFDKMVYNQHPYSRPEDGYPETVRKITHQDLVAFHQKHYGPQEMVIAIVGGIETERAVSKVDQALGKWQNPNQPEIASLPPLIPLYKIKREHTFIPGKSQTSLLMGTTGPLRKSKKYLPASLGNNILGQFGMYGRIGDVVREKAGMAYYAYSSLSSGVGPGPWYVLAGIDPANVEQAIGLIIEEIRKFVNEGVTQDELEDSKANFIGRLPLSLESNAGVASALIALKRYDLGFDYYQTYPDRVNTVTVEDVLEAARAYLNPEKLAIATAGPGS